MPDPNLPDARLIGFEKEERVRELLEKFRVMPDYPQALVPHLLDILRRQHPQTLIETIELLKVQKCSFGGTQHADRKLVTVQTMDVPLELRIGARVGASRIELDVTLTLKGEGLDTVPTLRSDMRVMSQR